MAETPQQFDSDDEADMSVAEMQWRNSMKLSSNRGEFCIIIFL